MRFRFQVILCLVLAAVEDDQGTLDIALAEKIEDRIYLRFELHLEGQLVRSAIPPVVRKQLFKILEALLVVVGPVRADAFDPVLQQSLRRQIGLIIYPPFAVLPTLRPRSQGINLRVDQVDVLGELCCHSELQYLAPHPDALHSQLRRGFFR